jgi:oligopeptide/dipeptide ABC transporter ATP-binding protein
MSAESPPLRAQAPQPASASGPNSALGPAPAQRPPLLEVRGLVKHFPAREGVWSRSRLSVKAVDGVDLEIERGRTLGLVGESGSGKTTTGRCIVRLIEPTAGDIRFDGIDLLSLGRRPLRALRRRLQIIFQDPFSSLNPRMRVRSIVGEPLAIHRLAPRRERRRKVAELLRLVGLDPAAMDRYPHQFSGGQRQRIGIARALAVQPELVVCDEPVSALDVSVQAQVINLLQDLQERFGLSYLFIAHDLSVVEHISDRVAVMYLGRIVEMADADALYSDPRHPYSRALMSAVPIPDPDLRRERILLQGDVPSPLNPPPGCSFHPRCSARKDLCAHEAPVLRDVGGGHEVACHLTGAPS